MIVALAVRPIMPSMETRGFSPTLLLVNIQFYDTNFSLHLVTSRFKKEQHVIPSFVSSLYDV